MCIRILIICFLNIKLFFFLGKPMESVSIFIQYIHIYILIYIKKLQYYLQEKMIWETSNKTLYKFHKFRVIEQDLKAVCSNNHQNYHSDMINHTYSLLHKVNDFERVWKRPKVLGWKVSFFYFILFWFCISSWPLYKSLHHGISCVYNKQWVISFSFHI